MCHGMQVLPLLAMGRRILKFGRRKRQFYIFLDFFHMILVIRRVFVYVELPS